QRRGHSRALRAHAARPRVTPQRARRGLSHRRGAHQDRRRAERPHAQRGPRLARGHALAQAHAGADRGAVSGTPVLRIFSYLPNPRLAKATIAARLCGVELEVRGAAPRELGGWLWDFDARALAPGESPAGTARSARTGFAGTLHKTDAFPAAHPV